MRLEGRVGIVSGIGPGMGRSIALALAREGADVVLAARGEEKLTAVAKEVEALGRRAVWRPTNIVNPDDCSALVDLATSELGRIDVLVNNAFAHPPMRSIMDAPSDDWNLVHKVNVVGTIQMTKAAVPHMKDGSSVVMVASMAARTGQPGEGPYAASKAALLTAVRTLAQELGPQGVRVNAIVPGYIWGPSLEIWFDYLAKERGVDPSDVYDEVASQTALRHIPTADEIAEAVLFMASPMSRAITGQALDVNGGHYFH